MFLFKPPDIDKLEAKKDVKGLIQALDYKKSSGDDVSKKLRKKAIGALIQIGDKRAVDSLEGAYKREKNDMAKNEIAKALNKID